MRLRLLLAVAAALVLAPASEAQKKYSGPRPPKPDVPFLLIIDRLAELESGMANQENGKDGTVYSVSGPTSSVRTPMPEPIFLMQASKLNPERFALFKMTVENGKRTLTLPTGRKAKNAPKPVYFLTTPLDGGLFKIEVNEFIESGEYCFSPDGSNEVFCFTTF